MISGRSLALRPRRAKQAPPWAWLRARARHGSGSDATADGDRADRRSQQGGGEKSGPGSSQVYGGIVRIDRQACPWRHGPGVLERVSSRPLGSYIRRTRPTPCALVTRALPSRSWRSWAPGPSDRSMPRLTSTRPISWISTWRLPIATRGSSPRSSMVGSLEHVFNFPTALRSCMEMLAIGPVLCSRHLIGVGCAPKSAIFWRWGRVSVKQF